MSSPYLTGDETPGGVQGGLIFVLAPAKNHTCDIVAFGKYLWNE